MLRVLAIAIAVLALLYAAVRVLGDRRWSAGTRALRARLEAARQPARPASVDFGEFAGLPEPVQRYFRTALTEGQPMLTGAAIRHEGTFNPSERGEEWRPFSSDQIVTTQPPGFDWDGRIAMAPGLLVRVHDAYVAGEGRLLASLLGLVPIADLRGGAALAEGELMRYLAEAVWYPTALLPSQGVHWEPLDARSAQATLADGPVRVSLRFDFGDGGLVERVSAEARGRSVNGRSVPTPWHGRFWAYGDTDGMRVPMQGEVAWGHRDGVRPYWRGRITHIAFGRAD